jgi:hypothetical protein
MGSPIELDFGGDIIVCKDIKIGATGVNQSGSTRKTTAAGSTLTVNRGSHLGRTVLLDTLTGSVVTLPAATGTGDTYRFFVSVAPTSNNHIVKVANASDTMVGTLILVPTTIAGAVTVNSAEAAGGTDDTITMNGTTSGAIAGSYIECTDIASTLWLINGRLVASGTLTTPLSATV